MRAEYWVVLASTVVLSVFLGKSVMEGDLVSAALYAMMIGWSYLAVLVWRRMDREAAKREQEQRERSEV